MLPEISDDEYKEWLAGLEADDMVWILTPATGGMVPRYERCAARVSDHVPEAADHMIAIDAPGWCKSRRQTFQARDGRYRPEKLRDVSVIVPVAHDEMEQWAREFERQHILYELAQADGSDIDLEDLRRVSALMGLPESGLRIPGD